LGLIARGKANLLAWLDEAWQDELCRGEVPSIHGTDRVLTDEL
jgi:hypothetical protein